MILLNKAPLLSFLPSGLLTILEILRLIANAFTLPVRWLHDNFWIRSPSSAEGPLHLSLAFALEAHKRHSRRGCCIVCCTAKIPWIWPLSLHPFWMWFPWNQVLTTQPKDSLISDQLNDRMLLDSLVCKKQSVISEDYITDKPEGSKVKGHALTSHIHLKICVVMLLSTKKTLYLLKWAQKIGDYWVVMCWHESSIFWKLM